MDRITVGSPEEGRATYQKIIEEMRENLWYFIPVGNIKVPLILNADIRNVPDNEGFAMAINFSGEMMFYEE
jgi:peptide/nickel transport system substrate-binding protein